MRNFSRLSVIALSKTYFTFVLDIYILLHRNQVGVYIYMQYFLVERAAQYDYILQMQSESVMHRKLRTIPFFLPLDTRVFYLNYFIYIFAKQNTIRLVNSYFSSNVFNV